MKRHLRFYDIILATFVAILLISNVSATKLISFGPIIVDGGVVLFPLAYIIGDVLTEVYGYKYTRRAIWAAFGAMLLGVIAFTIVRYMPAASSYNDQVAFESVFGFYPRIVAASLMAFVVGSFMNSYVIAKLKVYTKGRRLWLRLIGSTFFGQFVDTVVFGLVAFAGVLSASDMVVFVIVGWLFKVVVEVMILPGTYRVISYIKKAEGVDEYDELTDFSPFKLRI